MCLRLHPLRVHALPLMAVSHHSLRMRISPNRSHLGDQYAPVPMTAEGIVFSVIFRSRSGDQFSM
jgi:hypothetical protein